MTESKYCPRCQQEVPLRGWIPNKARTDGLGSYCRSCHGEINKTVAAKRREELLQSLGGACVRCGFSDDRALQVDHVNGNGFKERKSGINPTTAKFRRLVLDHPDEYQILCANCNAIKRIENGEHGPQRVHKTPGPDRERSPGKHTPEANARRSASLKAYWENADELKREKSDLARKMNDSRTDEQKAEIGAKISAARSGTKKGPDGKWYRP